MIEQLQQIGVGKVADVYTWQDDRVLKLLHAGLPIEYARHELAVMQTVAERGLPIPSPDRVVTVADRHGVIMERVEGILLFEAWLGNVAEFRPIFDLLAELHHQIHANQDPLPEFIPSQRGWLHNTIAESALLVARDKQAALATLDTLKDKTTLCHGDLHPGNVIIRNDGTPIIIDWFSATAGSPLADVARTALLITHAPLPDAINSLLPASIRVEAATYFVETCMRGRENDLIAQWQSVISAAMIAEGMHPQSI